MRIKLSLLRDIVFVFTFTGIAGTFTKYFTIGNDIVNATECIFILISFFIAIKLYLIRRAKNFTLLMYKFSLFLFVFLEIFISLFYFMDTYKNLFKYIGTISVVVVALYNYKDDFKRLINCIFYALCIFTVVSIYAIYAENQLELFSLGGDNGVYGAMTQKNVFAFILLYEFMIILHYLTEKDTLSIVRRKLNVKIILFIYIGIIASLLILSRCSSAIICALFLIVWNVFYGKLRTLNIAHFYFIFNLLLLLYTYSYEKWDLGSLLGSYFDKDITLTGRTDIWSAVLQAIKNFNIFGYGTYHFGDQNFQNYVLDHVYNLPGLHAHNNLLEMTVETGILGVSIFVIAILCCSKLLVNLTKKRKESFKLLSSCLLVFAVIGSVDYSISPGTFSQFMFYLLLFKTFDLSYK